MAISTNLLNKVAALAACLFVSVSVLFFGSTQKNAAGDGMAENLAERQQWMLKMLADPSTGKYPMGIRSAELTFANQLPVANLMGKFATWSNMGPWNVGGRTRAFAVDLNDANVLLAGGATGGVWRSNNGGQNWVAMDMSQVPTGNITSLVQDSRTGKRNIWYASTGELYGGSLPGAFYNGSGVYKSTDGGFTWQKAGNVNGGLGGINNAWSVIHRVALNPKIDTADVVFVANFDGIFRSINGGLNWIRVRGGTSSISGYSYFTDVAVTPSGVIYATLSGGGNHQGIWRSTDNGKTWASITPAGFQSTWGRIVIGIAPSDEKQVYFAAYTPGQGKESKNFEGNSEWNSLWKYTYISGDGTGNGGSWENRSANLPAIGGAFGDFISQSGYCLEIDVKPDDPNTVFLGGTNLYRSTNGFANAQATTWIGGYGVGTFLPDFKLYPNHHPDNHGVIFAPGSNNKAYSIHDGGISLTTDIMQSQVAWQSLNNGYLTTQFYTVAQAPDAGIPLVLGGTQDNGTYLNAVNQSNAPWSMPLSYDGSYCYVKPGGLEAYLSIQQGRVFRVVFDASGKAQQYARIDPSGVDKSTYQFINPFTPDAFDDKILYQPAGNVLWRNSNVNAIPLQAQLDSTSSSVNWTMLHNTRLTLSSDEITAVLSSQHQPGVLYYGTARGNLYKLSNNGDTASIPLPIKGSNFPTAYINCIAQHPTDSQTLFVVFTNYEVLSIFRTTDGGKTWQAISGNLEQNSNGSGNGPSCRWLSIASVQDSLVYFVGTSVGLYATKQISGMQTVWSRQGANTIGTQIVTMMNYRKSDGRMVASTYGSGVFGAIVNSLNPKTGLDKLNNDNSFQLYPNPTQESLVLKDVPLGTLINIVSNNGDAVYSGIYNGTSLNVEQLVSGVYYLHISVNGEVKSRKFIKL